MFQSFWQKVKAKVRKWRDDAWKQVGKVGSAIWAQVRAVIDHPATQLILARLSEKTTWLGLASILSTWGIVFAPDAVDLYFTTVIGLAGFAIALWNTITLPTHVNGGAVKAGVKDSVAAGIAPEEAMAVGLQVAEDIGATQDT